jgi:hypothetical protein
LHVLGRRGTAMAQAFGKRQSRVVRLVGSHEGFRVASPCVTGALAPLPRPENRLRDPSFAHWQVVRAAAPPMQVIGFGHSMVVWQTCGASMQSA